MALTIETRQLVSPVAIRQDRTQGGEGTTLSGYGAIFNSVAIIGGTFREVVVPGAFTETVQEDDLRVVFNHDTGRVLGRQSAGTARVLEDAFGLFYAVAINPDDPDALSVLAKIKRRDVTGSSFRFTVRPEDEEWTFNKRDTMPTRTILRARVIELGPVSWPAYEATSAIVRATDAGIAARDLAAMQLAIAKARRV